MVSFLKQDHYGHIQQVLLAPCLCSCNIKLANDQVHIHKIATINDEYRYVRNYMRKWEQENKK